MVDNALSQYSALAILILRLFVGVIFIVHGWAKVDPRGQMGGMSGWGKILRQMGIPAPAFFGYLSSLWELIGGALIISGLLSRLWAAGFVVIMLVAIFRVKIPRGVAFWPRQPGQGGGWEFDFLILGASLALVILGSGALGLDRVLVLPI
jgi:putative oxidoreductase